MAVAVTDAPEATEDESQFRIEATGALREPRTRILKHGETFGVLNQFGDMVGEPGSPDGLYHQDTRFLSQLELRLNGDRPLLLSFNPAEDGSALPVDLANTDTAAADGSEVRGQKREQRGKRSAERLSSDAVALRYLGLDGVERRTTLRFAPA